MYQIIATSALGRIHSFGRFSDSAEAAREVHRLRRQEEYLGYPASDYRIVEVDHTENAARSSARYARRI